MKSYDYLKRTLSEAVKAGKPAQWRYRGPGYGQGLIHSLALLDPHEAVTSSMDHGWLGSPEDFMIQFELVAT